MKALLILCLMLVVSNVFSTEITLKHSTEYKDGQYYLVSRSEIPVTEEEERNKFYTAVELNSFNVCAKKQMLAELKLQKALPDEKKINEVSRTIKCVKPSKDVAIWFQKWVISECQKNETDFGISDLCKIALPQAMALTVK
jgi:hypothetical protein